MADPKLPPQSVEAEEAVLGGLLIDSDAIYRVVDFLSINDFYKTANRTVYETILELFELKQPVDVLTLTNKLRERKKLDEVGGTSYLASLINRTPTAANINHYARIIFEKRVRRDLIQVANEIYQEAFKEETETDGLIDAIESKIYQITQKSSPFQFSHIKNFLVGAYERIEHLHKGEKAFRGVPTGFEQLDDKLGGLQRSDLILLAARPTLGKTSLALDIVRYVAIKLKIPVGVFSLEMSADQVIDRLIASEAGVSLWRMRTGKLMLEGEVNEMAFIAEAYDRLSAAPIYVDDSPSSNILQMRAMARRLQSEVGLGLIVVDYIQLIKSHRIFESRVHEITEISQGLKSLARELNVPVLGISQLSRAPEQRAGQSPKLSDLRDSGSLEQDADVVMFIHKPQQGEAQRTSFTQLIIAKHRNGPVGMVPLHFDIEAVSFKTLTEATEQEAEIY